MRFGLLFIPMLFILGCQEGEVPNNDLDETWTIDTEYLRQGCYDGKDCIPSLENPERSEVNGADLDFLDDDDLVVGIWNGSEHIAYPHSILDWHEIVNEDGYSISYCPLTGSAIHLSSPSEFGVSGLLFNSNLIMYDRETDSYWPQMLLHSASGSSTGDALVLKNLVETSWSTWKALFPDTKVLNANTGHSRNYDRYPYGDYRTCNSPSCGDYIYFPIANEDNQLSAKQRVLTLIHGDSVKAVDLESYPEPQILELNVGDKAFQVVISGDDDIAVAFQTNQSLSISSWDISTGDITLGETGTDDKWDITGRLISETDASRDLVPGNAYIAYWFSVAAFFPDVELISP